MSAEFGFLSPIRKSITLPMGHITYTDVGSGPTLLLLHGAPMTSLSFGRALDVWAPRYRVLAPDFPGFGESSAAVDFGGRLSDYADFVEAFCEALNLDDVYLYLSDASGAIGLDAASRMPSRIAGLVLAGTVAFPLTGRAWVVRLMLKYVVSSRLVRFLNRRFNLFPWMVASVAPFLRPLTPVEQHKLRSQFDTEAKRERVIDVFEHMGRDTAFMAAIPHRVHAALRDTPTLLLFGQFDPVRFVGAIGRFRRMFSRPKVCIIPLEEHFPILASGKRVGEEVDQWIQSVQVGRDETADAGRRQRHRPHSDGHGAPRRASSARA